MTAYTIADDRSCFNCGEKGHLSYNCPQPKNYNSYDGGRGGRGRGRSGRGGRGGFDGGRGGRGGYDGGRGGRGSYDLSRGGRGGGCGRGRGRGGTRANAAMTEESSHVTLTGDQAAEWEAW